MKSRIVKVPPTQLAQILDQGDANAVMEEAQRIFEYWYPAAEWKIVASTYNWIKRLFSGNYPGYRACNTDYHNIFHTTDVLIAAVRLMDGRALKKDPFPIEICINLYLAALMHDTGYIQEATDTEGTGAKHTKNHVTRSEQFVVKNAGILGLSELETRRIPLLIECTNLGTPPESINFSSLEEREAGFILGTADLLGQMADRAYLEKLLFLYYEFKEAGFPGYNTEFDILKNTMSFYASTKARLDNGLAKMYRYASRHFEKRYGTNANLYIQSIENQMNYLQFILEDTSCNFRKKLKRIDLEKVKSPLAG